MLERSSAPDLQAKCPDGRRQDRIHAVFGRQRHVANIRCSDGIIRMALPLATWRNSRELNTPLDVSRRALSSTERYHTSVPNRICDTPTTDLSARSATGLLI